ncbi:uncharacterized protein LOC107369568 [Tetranychus urticae]|uniref:uncharacterized protein LOC107369568 n=1 Tax=Tetranychus urticae TaxID=32264 RepID=UPI00077C06FC|nr:uncharacterized protein LOC107369568 [Tetranychus urticae]
MDMEAVITYPDGSMVKSTARVMKQGDVISYEITEGTEFVRSIELPPPLGLFEVDEHSGQCRYRTSNYNKDVTLITKWPLKPSFNLLYYLVMKPSRDHPTTFIGDIPLGPFRVEEYRATNFLPNSIDAIIDYYYSSDKVKVPYKVVFTKDRSQFSLTSPDKIEVTIIDYRDDYFDFEDRFDVSGCYEKPGAFTWFQLVFSNPWMNDVTLELVRQGVQELLLQFIPITRIGQIHAVNIDTNVYVTVKLHDRIHLIDTYQVKRGYTISSPTDIVQKLTPEDCEQLCSSTTACYDFSYCSNFDCFILAFPSSSIIDTQYNEDCNLYRRVWFGHKLSEYVKGNHLSSILHVLQQIRNKVSEGQFVLHSAALTAEDLFIVSGPDEIGDISQEYKQGTFRPVKGEDFPLIKTGRHFNEAQFKIEKGSLTECFMACLNDEDCNTLSYCINKNKECILSGETSTTLDNKLEDKTSHADGCNIYEKSFINLFSEFPGKNLVLDAVSTVSNVIITDCAKACAQTKDFNCESFDYCSDNNNRNGSICYLHVNHIETDTAHEINRTNWKFAEDGCTHFSKKSDRDYEHKVGYSLKDDVKESVVGTFSHLSLDHCASKCNSNPDCFTLEFCETIGYDSTFDSSFSSSSCRLTNLKSTSVVNQTQFFEQSKDPKKICSIFINHMKIIAKDKSKESSPSTMKSNHFNLAIGTGAAIFILSLAGGFVGFTFASRKGLV